MTAAPVTPARFRGIHWAWVALALAMRLVFVLRAPATIVSPDGREFEAVALSLLEHGNYGMQTLRPPGYPTLMAAVWSLTGHHLLALRLVEAAIGAAAVAMVGWIGLRVFGARAGTIALALAALHPVLAFLPASQYSENLLVLVMVLAWGAWLGALSDPRAGLGRWAAGGALAGLAMLIRPNVVLLLPGFAIGAAVVLARARRAWIAPALVTAAAAALVLAPWIVRSHNVHDRWFLVASGGGRALWLGNNDHATGRPGAIVPKDTALWMRLMREPDEIAVDRQFGAEAWRWIGAHPRRAAELYLVRLGGLFALWPETYVRVGMLEQAGRAAQGLVSLATYAGAILGWFALRGSPVRAPMLAAIAGFALVHAMFFSVLRYRLPFEPLLMWAAGAGWTWWLARRRRPAAGAPSP